MGWIWRGPDDAHGLCLLHLHVWLHHPCGHHSHLLCQDYQDHQVYSKHTFKNCNTHSESYLPVFYCKACCFEWNQTIKWITSPKITCLFQNILHTSNSSTWKSPGLQSRVKKDRKLTIMLAVMVIVSQKKQISIPSFSDYFLPCDVVPLCLCLHSRDCCLHPQDQPLLLHPGHPNHAHQVSCLHRPNHLLLAQPSVPGGDVGLTWNVKQEDMWFISNGAVRR